MKVIHARSDLAESAVDHLARLVADGLRRKPRLSLALSGGESTESVWRALANAPVDWERVDIYQVDERVAPHGDPARNLSGLTATLLDHVSATVHSMPVDAPDLEAAAARYAEHLPAVLDLVHLGLGDDGHTASLVPGDPVLEETERTVAVTGTYQGHRRMTLTFPTLARSDRIVWIVAGKEKAPMVERLLARDTTIPAGRIPQHNATLITDSI